MVEKKNPVSKRSGILVFEVDFEFLLSATQPCPRAPPQPDSGSRSSVTPSGRHTLRVTIAGGSLARDAASHGSEWVTSSRFQLKMSKVYYLRQHATNNYRFLQYA